MLNIDISEIFYKNKQIYVSIEIVLVRCLTSQRAEKTIPAKLTVCTAIDNRTHLQNTGCFTIVETKRQLLKPLSMTLFIFLFPDCHREIVNLSIY